MGCVIAVAQNNSILSRYYYMYKFTAKSAGERILIIVSIWQKLRGKSCGLFFPDMM